MIVLALTQSITTIIDKTDNTNLSHQCSVAVGMIEFEGRALLFFGLYCFFSVISVSPLIATVFHQAVKSAEERDSPHDSARKPREPHQRENVSYFRHEV